MSYIENKNQGAFSSLFSKNEKFDKDYSLQYPGFA